MGSIIDRRSKGAREPHWYVVYRELDGKQAWRPTPKGHTKAQARKLLAKAEANVAEGRVGMARQPRPEELERRRVTLGTLCDRFVAEYTNPRIKDLERYRSDVRSAFKTHVKPHRIGAAPAMELTTQQLRDFRDELLAGDESDNAPSAETVKKVLAFLGRLYNWANDQQLIDCRNPVSKVGYPVDHSRVANDFDYLAAEEVARLLAWAQRHQPAEFPLYATAVHTGMRMGELFGLRWTDVEFGGGRIHVRRSYRTTPKSGKGRTLPLSPHLAPTLRAWTAICRPTAEGLVFPAPLPEERGKLTRTQAEELRHRAAAGESRAVLGRTFGISWNAASKIANGVSWREREPDDSGMRDKNADFGFHDALAAAGCHRVRFHDLRHTYASHFVMAGGSILALQKLLGHADLKTTMKYAHLSPDFMAAEGALVRFSSAAVI
jgi:integrase